MRRVGSGSKRCTALGPGVPRKETGLIRDTARPLERGLDKDSDIRFSEACRGDVRQVNDSRCDLCFGGLAGVTLRGGLSEVERTAGRPRVDLGAENDKEGLGKGFGTVRREPTGCFTTS